jgi:hypothetical protein
MTPIQLESAQAKIYKIKKLGDESTMKTGFRIGYAYGRNQLTSILLALSDADPSNI